MTGWEWQTPPGSGDVARMRWHAERWAASEAHGLVNGSISSREGQNEPSDPQNEGPAIYKTDPHPERRTPQGVAVIRPSGLAVKKQDKASVRNPRVHERGVVKGRSRKSRRRLMDKMSQVDMQPYSAQRKNARAAKALFPTLTYPEKYPDWYDAAEDLQTFRKRLERAYKVDWALWVKEPQKRGAPHYHLLVVFRGPVNVARFRRWLSKNWDEVVDSGDPKHRRAGTHVVPVHLVHGVGCLMGYMAKEMGKIAQSRLIDPETGELLATGRTWGFWHKDRVPFQTLGVVIFETRAAWDEFRRRVACYFRQSSYLSTVDQLREWAGALLYGDGWELLKILILGVPGIEVKGAPA